MGCRPSKDQDSLDLVHFNMLLLGYSGAGKTQLLSVIKGNHTNSKSTLEINTLNLQKLQFTVFQVTGKAQITWKNFYPITDLLMFLIDPTDTLSLQKTHSKLQQIDQSLKPTSKIFIVVNKIDLLTQNTHSTDSSHTQTPTIQQIIQNLQLPTLKHHFQWAQCSASTGQGIKQLLQKLQTFLLTKKSQTP